MIELRSLGFAEAMLFGHGRTCEEGPRVLDWDKAAALVASTDGEVCAGLAEDWGYTSGVIGRGGRQVRDYVYAGSDWATPVVEMPDGDVVECWVRADWWFDPDYPEWWGSEGVPHA